MFVPFINWLYWKGYLWIEQCNNINIISLDIKISWRVLIYSFVNIEKFLFNNISIIILNLLFWKHIHKSELTKILFK